MTVLELTYARTARAMPMMALVPVARPSIPSVRLAPLLTAVTMRMTKGMNTTQTYWAASSTSQDRSQA